MDDVFALLDPHEAQVFLKRLPAAARRRGEACLGNGGVEKLTPTDPGMAYSAQVMDGGLYQVQLFYDSDEGWGGVCSCPQKADCEHPTRSSDHHASSTSCPVPRLAFSANAGPGSRPMRSDRSAPVHAGPCPSVICWLMV